MPATGDLKRPFKPPAGLFSGMQQQNGPQTDKVCMWEVGGLGEADLRLFHPTLLHALSVHLHDRHPSRRLNMWLRRSEPRPSNVIFFSYVVDVFVGKHAFTHTLSCCA